VALLAGIVAAVVVVVMWPRQLEPEYKGRKLSEWLAMYTRPWDFGEPWERQQEASKAVSHVGTNALPWLMKWIAYDYPPPRLTLRTFAMRLPRPISHFFLGWVWQQKTKAVVLAEDAVGGFKVIGTQGSPALPELVRLMRDRKSPERSLNALLALGYLGKDAVPPLLAALTDPQQPSRAEAAWALSKMGANAASAVPTLVRSLGDQDPRVRLLAAKALGQLGLEPELVVPALTNCLGTSDSNLRSMAMGSIGDFGEQAACAIPCLLSALNDPDPQVGSSASNALYRIRPEALPKSSRESRVESAEPEEK